MNIQIECIHDWFTTVNPYNNRGYRWCRLCRKQQVQVFWRWWMPIPIWQDEIEFLRNVK